ncbi:MAG: glycosyltransferase [Acidimicrobiales bacterium]
MSHQDSTTRRPAVSATQAPGPSGSAAVAGMAPVAIVILTWNALEYTRRCLDALLGLTEHPQWRIVLVDNGSTDGTVDWLTQAVAERPERLSLQTNATNLGFTKGVNIGLAACRGDEDVVLMNNDVVVVDPAWLTKLAEVAHRRDDLGADLRTGVVGTRLVEGSGRLNHTGSYMPPVSLYGQQMGGGELDINQCVRTRDVECVVFAQVYLRRDAIAAVGPLDEEFFAYFEDTDWCLRARRAGFGVAYAGGVSPVHFHNTSTRENKVDFWSMYEKSRATFSRKWSSWLEHERYDAEVTWNSVVTRPLGYALHSRKMMLALHFAGLRVSYRNAYGAADDPVTHRLLADLVERKPNRGATQVAYCQADAFGSVKGRHRVGWTMLEVSGLPRSWVAGANQMDEVWVPASFNLETFANSGVRTPMRVMPLGVDVDYYHPEIRSFRPSERFTFLSVFEWGERKAPEILLRAFAEEFKSSEDVMLLLSVFNRDPSVDVAAEMAKLNLGNCPPVMVMVNAEFDDAQMGSLYRSADCFVLPTRGEGWGMPVAEAMACGLPTIATVWSGPADFLDDSVGFPLEVGAMVPAVARCPYYDGFQWAEPSFEHLRFLMRQVFDDADAARAKGLAAAERMATRYTWEHAAARVKARLAELG